MKNKLDDELVVALVVTAGVCAACMFKDVKKRITKYFKTKKLESLRNRIEEEFWRWRKLTAESKKYRLLLKSSFTANVYAVLKSALDYLINSDIADGHKCTVK